MALEGIWELVNQITSVEQKKACLYNICDNYIENNQFDKVRQICESELAADFKDELLQRMDGESEAMTLLPPVDFKHSKP